MFSSAEYWRDKADKVRAIANCMKDEETKRMIAKLASDYEKDPEPSSDAWRNVDVDHQPNLSSVKGICADAWRSFFLARDPVQLKWSRQQNVDRVLPLHRA